MKKASIIIILLGLFALTSFSQEFDGGIMVGIAGTQVQGDELGGFNKAGIFVGPYLSLKLSYRSSVQMGLEFAQKGSRQNPDSTNNFESYLIRLNYLQIPINYQFKYNKRFGFTTGLSYGILVYDEELTNGYDLDLGQPSFNKGDFNFHFGINWFTTPTLTTKLEFANSIVPIRKVSEAENINNILKNGQYNTVLMLAIQYNITSFRRKKE